MNGFDSVDKMLRGFGSFVGVIIQREGRERANTPANKDLSR